MAEYYPKSGVCYDHRERSKIYMIYTFACNAACDHCLVESNPRKKAKLDPATAIDILTKGAAYGKNFLDLSGGEAMLFPEEIKEVMRAARDLGYYICLNTNGFWARTPDKARETLGELKDAGLKAVFPSASAYHLKYVPLERVKNVRQACADLDVVYELNWFYSHQEKTDAWIKREMDLDEEVIFFDGLTEAGNNPDTVDQLRQSYKTRTPDDLDDCLSVHLGVNPHGHVVTTCNMTFTNDKFKNSPFFLGNFYEQPFEDILAAERDSAVLQFIYGNPHPAMHRLLSDDDEVGEYYRANFLTRSYFSIIDYYLDVLRDEKLMPRLEACLPAPADGVAVG